MNKEEAEALALQIGGDAIVAYDDRTQKYTVITGLSSPEIAEILQQEGVNINEKADSRLDE